MIDIFYNKINLPLALYCLLMYAMLVGFNWKPCSWPQECTDKMKRKQRLFFTAVFFFALTCCVDSDFFGYQWMVWYFDFGVGAVNHGEPFYHWLIRITHQNYLLFRTVVWGGALILTYRAMKRFKVDPYVGMYMMVAGYFITFVYARASLAMAVYFYGLSFLTEERGKQLKHIDLLKISFGLLMIFCSYMFHHTMVITILLTALVFVPFNKRTMIMILIATPILFYIFADIFSQLIEGSADGENELLGRVGRYSEDEALKANWKGHLQAAIGYLTYYVPLGIITFKLYFDKKVYKVSRPIMKLYRVTFGLVFVSHLFLGLGLETNVFFYRTLFITFIPICIMLSYMAEKQIIRRKTYAWLLILGIISQLYKYLLQVYVCW